MWISNISFGQIVSGEYDFGLNLAYDIKTNVLTGYFENYTGMDEETGEPRFSCIFYIHGTISGSQFIVDTYYPNVTVNTIKGGIQIINNNTVGIKLTEEHGGCWNVQHFAEEQVKFSIEKHIAWTQIRYIAIDKTYFYSNKSNDKKQKSYLVKNDVVFIDKNEGDWAYCSFYGQTMTQGWIKTIDLNKI